MALHLLQVRFWLNCHPGTEWANQAVASAGICLILFSSSSSRRSQIQAALRYLLQSHRAAPANG